MLNLKEIAVIDIKIAVIYSRVSTGIQDNHRQIQELQAYAKYAKYQVLQVFEEKVSDAVKGKARTEFSKMLEFVQQNEVQCVLVWELSRIGRSMLDVLNNIEELTNQKVNIYIKKDNLTTLDEHGEKSLMTNIIISVLSGFAEMERDTTKKRIISGLRGSVARGGSGSSLLKPYGYANVNKMLVIDNEESEIVQLIYQKYLEGLGTSQLAGMLNKMKIPTRFNKAFGDKIVLTRSGRKRKGSDYSWSDGTIYSILNNTIYYGERNYKGEVFAAPAIITRQTFDLVQARLKGSYNKSSSEKKYENVLAGLLKCPKCGQNYYMHKRANNSDNAYKCISVRYKKRCGNPSINIDKLNFALYWYCQPIIYNDSMQGNTDSLASSIENKKIELENIIDAIETNKTKLKRDLKFLRDALISESDFEEYKVETETELLRLNQKRLKVIGEIVSLENLSKKKIDDGYTYEMFKKFLPDAVEYVRVHEVVKPKRFKQILTVKNDVPYIVEVKTKLVDVSGTPINYFITMTRYSKNIASVQFDKEIDNIKDYQKEIECGRLQPDNDAIMNLNQLRELGPLKRKKNPHFVKASQPLLD